MSMHTVHPSVVAEQPFGTSAFRPPRAPAGGHLVGSLDLMGSPLSFGRNEEIYGENDEAEYVYKIVRGTVRIYKIMSDGRRQIGAFYLPGDIFGMEVGALHEFSAEAIGNATVLVIKRSALISLADRDGVVARELWAFTACELRRLQRHVLLLIQSAQERVAAFLLEMSDRVASNDAIELPMSRQDIADYLGLTIETVSRTLTQLETAATIALPTSRRVVLRNRGALCRLNA